MAETNEVNLIFGRNLAALRGAAGMSRKVLAEKIDADEILLGAYERGERTPKFPRLLKIADIFNVTVDSLLRDASKVTTQTQPPVTNDLLLSDTFQFPYFSIFGKKQKFTPENFFAKICDGVLQVNADTTNEEILRLLQPNYPVAEADLQAKLDTITIIYNRLKKFQKFMIRRHDRLHKCSLYLLKQKDCENDYSKLLLNYSNTLAKFSPPLMDIFQTLEGYIKNTDTAINKSYCRRFGKNLKKYRKLRGLTQIQLANFLNISHSGIADYETGNRTPNLTLLHRLQKILNVPLLRLID